jgi:hypothetical protein
MKSRIRSDRPRRSTPSSRPSWRSAACRPAAKGHVPCMSASLPPPPSARRSPAIRPAQHLSVASATVGANSATAGTNSATDVRASAETAMYHTMVMACVTVISEPLGKLTNWLVRWLDNGGSVVVRDHPLPALLQKVERLADRLEFIEMMQLSLKKPPPCRSANCCCLRAACQSGARPSGPRSSYPAQHESCFTSLVNVCAASFRPSTIVR